MTLKKKKSFKDIDKDDINLEVEEMVAEDEGHAEKVKKLQDELKVCREKCQEYLTGWQRAKADFVNARSRDKEDKATAERFAALRVLEELLPSIDSFESAMANAKQWSAVDEKWRMGMTGIYTQLLGVLKAHEMVAIEPVGGSVFNPAEHEAIGSERVNDIEPGAIVRIMQKGYKMHNRVVRPARVILAEK